MSVEEGVCVICVCVCVGEGGFVWLWVLKGGGGLCMYVCTRVCERLMNGGAAWVLSLRQVTASSLMNTDLTIPI